jgi:hypothetical protein
MTPSTIRSAPDPAEQPAIITTVIFQGDLADRFGNEREVTLPAEGCPVGVLRDALGLLADGGEAALRGADIAVAVDRIVVDDADWARPGQEIAFFIKT